MFCKNKHIHNHCTEAYKSIVFVPDVMCSFRLSRCLMKASAFNLFRGILFYYNPLWCPNSALTPLRLWIIMRAVCVKWRGASRAPNTMSYMESWWRGGKRKTRMTHSVINVVSSSSRHVIFGQIGLLWDGEGLEWVPNTRTHTLLIIQGLLFTDVEETHYKDTLFCRPAGSCPGTTPPVSARRPLSSEGGRAVRQLPLCHGQPPPTGYQSWHHPSLPFILSSSTWRIHSKHTRPFSSTQTSHRVITKATVVCASLIDPVCSVHGPRPEPTLNTHHNQSACEFQHSQYTIHS